MELKLETLRDFLDKHPTAHVGGSIGLMLRGINLRRELCSSDLDITVDEFNCLDLSSEGLSERSDGNDFDHSLKKDHVDGNYTKIDIRINPEPSFEVISYNGITYNVSKLRDILFWKKKYADKGVIKHINDLIVIETGIRPLYDITPTVFYDDDLPF